ncbi:MAG: NfeD family protein [Ignavibacteria bacterium]|nr:NfeD family protein [Ignavibacteria bacterium]
MEYYWWFAAALLFFILEIVTPGFVLMWFGVGAIVAGLLSLFGVSNALVQAIVFVAVSLIMLSLSRTLFKNVFMRSSPGAGLKTNMDALVGRTGLVTEGIDIERSRGRVTVEGQDWAARSIDRAPITLSSRVEVTGFEGASLIVRRIEE